MSDHALSFTERVMQFFRDNPERWIDATRLEAIGGRQAWRTRVSDARKRFQAAGEGDIQNRVRYQYEHEPSCPGIQAWDMPDACNCGKPRRWTLSEYMFVPTPEAHPPQRSAATPHDTNFKGPNPETGRLW